MMPSLMAGVALLNGNRNPVTLVKAVVAKKTTAHPSRRLLVRKTYIVTSLDAIPARLINTVWNVSGERSGGQDEDLKALVAASPFDDHRDLLWSLGL
jgi:hypothetical protein